MAYIHYDEKPNGAIYASVYESYREGGSVKTRRKENHRRSACASYSVRAKETLQALICKVSYGL